MNVEVIAVGTELLLGQIANTNGQFISQRLALMGYNCYFHTVVGDNEERLLSVIENAVKRADILLFTGGLGPTKDDITKEVIAEYLNCKLVYDEPSLQSILDYYKKVNRIPAENNKKQALVIEGSEAFFNDNGMAPGMAKQVDGKTYILLPGPPTEMKPMFQKVEDYFIKNIETDGKIYSRVLKFFGIGESQLEAELADIITNQTNPTVAPLAAEGEVTLRLTAKAESQEEAMSLIDRTESTIKAIVGDYLYGYDQDTLDAKVFSLLKKAQLTIASAESLTGGLFGNTLTAHTGASSVYKGGVICYQNEIKEHILHVPQTVLTNEGAVSAACAEQLARNVRKLFCSQIGISFTGVAGPSELEGKSVGTVYVGISIEGKGEKVIPLQLAGTREQIKMRSAKHGFSELIRLLKFNE